MPTVYQKDASGNPIAGTGKWVAPAPTPAPAPAANATYKIVGNELIDVATGRPAPTYPDQYTSAENKAKWINEQTAKPVPVSPAPQKLNESSSIDYSNRKQFVDTGTTSTPRVNLGKGTTTPKLSAGGTVPSGEKIVSEDERLYSQRQTYKESYSTNPWLQVFFPNPEQPAQVVVENPEWQPGISSPTASNRFLWVDNPAHVSPAEDFIVTTAVLAPYGGAAAAATTKVVGVVGSKVVLPIASKTILPLAEKVAATSLPKVLNMGERGAINIGSKTIGSVYDSTAGTIFSGTKTVIGGAVPQVVKSAAPKIAKEVGKFVLIEGVTEVGYEVAPLMPGIVRGGTTTYLNIIDPNSVYNPDAEDKAIIGEGWTAVNRELYGGGINYVDEKGEPVLDETGNQKTGTQPGTVNPIEAYLYQNIPFTKTIGKTQLITDNLTAAIKRTKGYKYASNKDSYLKKALMVEGVAGPFGGLLGQGINEVSSEIKISNQARFLIPGFTKLFRGNEKVGLITGLGVSSLRPGYQEGGKTIQVMANAERQTVTSEQIQSASVYGMASATTVNVILGGTFPYVKQRWFTPEITKVTKLGVEKIVTPAKWSIPKIAHYGTQAVAYAYDPLELGVDKAINFFRIKERAGLTVGVSPNIFVPATNQVVQSNQPIKIVVGTKNISVAQTNEPNPFKNYGRATSLLDNVGSKEDVIAPIDDNTKTDSPVKDDTSVVSQGDTISWVDNRTENQVNVINQTDIISSTQTNTNTNVNIPTIVSPFAPLIPPFFFGDSEYGGGKSSGRGKKKFYNELAAAGASFRGLDFGLVPFNKKGIAKKAKQYSIGAHHFSVGRAKVKKVNMNDLNLKRRKR
jgi:hypothetical protein